MQARNDPRHAIAPGVRGEPHRLRAEQPGLDDRIDELQIIGMGGEIEIHMRKIERAIHRPADRHAHRIARDRRLERPRLAGVGDRRRLRGEHHRITGDRARAGEPHALLGGRRQPNGEIAVLSGIAVADDRIVDRQPIEREPARAAAFAAEPPILPTILVAHQRDAQPARVDRLRRKMPGERGEGAEADQRRIDPGKIALARPGRLRNADAADRDRRGEGEEIAPLDRGDRHRLADRIGQMLLDSRLEQPPGEHRDDEQQNDDGDQQASHRPAEAPIGDEFACVHPPATLGRASRSDSDG